MSKEEDNKAVVGRWFTDCWGKNVNLAVIDEIAAPDMLLKYSLHENPAAITQRHQSVHDRFPGRVPGSKLWGTRRHRSPRGRLCRRSMGKGGGTHTRSSLWDFLIGGLPAATGRKMHFTGTTVLKVINGKIAEEIGLDDGVTALTQLGLIKVA